MAEENKTPDPAPTPGSPEYDAAMAAKFRQMSGQETPSADPVEKPERPEHIPEKFWDAEKGEVRVEDLAKSYAELERARGAPKAEESTPDPEVNPDAAKEVVDKAGLDWDKVSAQVQETGKLDDVTIAALEKIGIPRVMVDTYIAMAAEVSAQLTAKAVEHVGGEENMQALLKWAGDNLSDADKAHYNKLLGSRDGWQAALDTLSTLRARSSKTAGEPDLVSGGSNRTPAPAGYRSRVEMQKDMGDPRYWTDPAFRQAVERKMAVSTWDLDPRGGG